MTCNPAKAIKIKVREAPESRLPDFTDAEARQILSAARATPASNANPSRSAAFRWVPFICAYTGCRVAEATQLRAQDVTPHDSGGGFWVLRFTPEAGTIKSKKFRDVPIHPSLASSGFLAYVATIKEGPLFYDPKARRKADAESSQAQTRAGHLASWVRNIAGVTDPEVQPSHAWRHRFKTEGRMAGIEEQYMDAITGHRPPNVGRDYGRFPAEVLYREISKLTPEAIEGTRNLSCGMPSSIA